MIQKSTFKINTNRTGLATGASKNLFAHRHFLGHLTCWLVAFRRPGLLACRLASPSGGLLTARFVCFLCCWSVALSCQFLVLVWQLAPPKLMQYYELICTYICVCMFLVMGFMSQFFLGKEVLITSNYQLTTPSATTPPHPH